MNYNGRRQIVEPTVDMERIKKDIKVRLSSGLHIKPAQDLAESVRALDCEVLLGINDTRINAKSIMGLLTLAVPPGAIVTVEAIGRQSAEAVAAIERVLTDAGK